MKEAPVAADEAPEAQPVDEKTAEAAEIASNEKLAAGGAPPVQPGEEETAQSAKTPGDEKPAAAGKAARYKKPALAALVLFALGAVLVYWQAGAGSAPAKDVSPARHPLFTEARDFYQQENYKRAMVSAKELLNLEPGHTGAMVLVGWILIAEERPHEAIEAARSALQINPNLAEALAMEGQAKLLLGRWDEALEVSRKALILDTSQDTPYRVIGEVYLRQGRVADSIAVFEEALRLGPPTVGLLKKLGGAHIRNKDFQAAEAVLTRALLLDETDAGVHFNLARVYAETGDGERAIRHMENAERRYSEEGNTFWSAKARHNKLAIARKFHMTPDFLSPSAL